MLENLVTASPLEDWRQRARGVLGKADEEVFLWLAPPFVAMQKHDCEEA